MKVTENLNLNLPDFSNNANIEDLNKNSIIIDNEVNKLKVKLSNLEGTSATKEEIERIKKSISDLEEAQLIINNKINNLNTNKVDKISGKGLSTNDFTNAHKRKVDVELPELISKAGKVDMVNNIKPDESKNVNITGSDIPYNSDSDETILNKIDILNKEKADINDLSRSSTIVIANYDSHENSKKAADIIIEEGENAAVKINQAIQSLSGFGGEIQLMEGEYNLEYGLAVNVDGVHLTGIPGATVLIQNVNWKGNPKLDNRLHVVDTWSPNNHESINVIISNITINGNAINESSGFNCLGDSTIINCTSNNIGAYGFRFGDTSYLYMCTNNNDALGGFYMLWGSPNLSHCISNGSGGSNFYCRDSGVITNCVSSNAKLSGFYVDSNFKGVVAYNILQSDILTDNSSAPAKIEYNIIQEV